MRREPGFDDGPDIYRKLSRPLNPCFYCWCNCVWWKNLWVVLHLAFHFPFLQPPLKCPSCPLDTPSESKDVMLEAEYSTWSTFRSRRIKPQVMWPSKTWDHLYYYTVSVSLWSQIWFDFIQFQYQGFSRQMSPFWTSETELLHRDSVLQRASLSQSFTGHVHLSSEKVDKYLCFCICTFSWNLWGFME